MPDAAPLSLLDRARGALLGLAVGDALGTTVEFRPRGTFAPLTEIVGGGPFGLPAGAWTDDTSMALCLADSLLAQRRHDPADALRRYVAWYRHGERSSTDRCFDIGNATRQALERFEQTAEDAPGVAFPDAGGNGVLMRLAPLVVAHRFSRGAAIVAATAESNTTHGHPAARDAAKLQAGLLVDLLAGGTRESVLGPDGRFLAPGLLHDDVRALLDGAFRHPGPDPPAGVVGSGYAPKALEAALWAVWSTDDFAGAVRAAANLGDDADTTAAIAGQLAGALHGASGIPERWRSIVHLGPEIVALADGLLALSDDLAVEHRRRPSWPGAPDVDPGLPNDAFWFRDHELLAGPYPGAPAMSEAAAKLDALLDLGVRWFVDLTEEGEGPGPVGLHPYERLLRQRAAARGIEDVWHVRFPIRDVDVPRPARMRAILDVLERARATGTIVYLHCWGGVGRTGTVLGCLAVEDGSGGQEALDRLAHARRHTARARAGRVAPETAAQRAFVTSWRTPHVPRVDEDGAVPLIAGAELRATDVPAPWDDYDSVRRFAHTFDGYAAYAGRAEPDATGEPDVVGALAAVAKPVEERWHATGELPDDLDVLRGTLFFGFRADRFTWGDDVEMSAPDDDGVTHVVNARRPEDGPTPRFRRALVARIAELVQARA
jgi:ADP-ribosyl-[dinitrogen reductase] hydrolase